MTAALSTTLHDSVQRVAGTLQVRARQIERQLQALAQVQQQGAQAVGPGVLLVLYLDMPSGKAVADFCNAQGWRTAGAKGPRRFEPPDVYRAIREGGEGVCRELQAMAQQKLEGAAALKPAGWGGTD